MWICKNCNEQVDEELSICWNCSYDEDGNINECISEPPPSSYIDQKKSEDFNTLKTYKGLLYIVLLIFVISTLLGGMYLFSILSDIGFSNFLLQSIFIITSVLLYIYIIYCQILIIDFLFYLDDKIRD